MKRSWRRCCYYDTRRWVYGDREGCGWKDDLMAYSKMLNGLALQLGEDNLLMGRVAGLPWEEFVKSIGEAGL